VYDRIAFAGVGRFNEFETLRVAGIRYADLKGYSYSRTDVTGKGLANAYSQTLAQIFAHEIKPYEVDILVAELGLTMAEDNLYRVQFEGTVREADAFTALGANEDEIVAALDGNVTPDMSVEDALAAACRAIETGTGVDVADEGWETGFLDRGAARRTFRRLTTEELHAARS
jgi:proteasome alpha subunit